MTQLDDYGLDHHSISDTGSEESSVYSGELKNDQRAQSATVQRLDLLLGYSELNEFRTRFQINQQREILHQNRRTLLRKINEKEALLKCVQQALAKDQAELVVNGKEIQALDHLENDPASLDRHLTMGLLRDNTSAESTPRAGAQRSRSKNSSCQAPWIRDQLPGAAKTMPQLPDLSSSSSCIRVWPKVPGATVSMPDLPMMSVKSQDSSNDKDYQSQDGDRHVRASNDLCFLAEKISHQRPGAVTTMPDLPLVRSDTDSEGVVAHEEKQSKPRIHVAISMPDLPLLSDKWEDASNEEDCSSHGDVLDASSNMDLSCLAQRISHRMPGAACTMPVLPPMKAVDECFEERDDVPQVSPTSYAPTAQNHCIRTWQRPPGAAITMPDLPVIIDEDEDLETKEDNLDLEEEERAESSQPPLDCFGQAAPEEALKGKVPAGLRCGISGQLPWTYASRLRTVLSVPLLSGAEPELNLPRIEQHDR